MHVDVKAMLEQGTPMTVFPEGRLLSEIFHAERLAPFNVMLFDLGVRRHSAICLTPEGYKFGYIETKPDNERIFVPYGLPEPVTIFLIGISIHVYYQGDLADIGTIPAAAT